MPSPSEKGVVVSLWTSRHRDARRNDAWDDLMLLAEEAWTWRDPESLEDLEDCLLRLGLAVESEWS